MAAIDTNEVRDKAINVPRHFAKITGIRENSNLIRDVVVPDEVAAEDDVITYEFEMELDVYKCFTRQYGALVLRLYTDIPDPNEFVERRLEEMASRSAQMFGAGVALYMDSRTRQDLMFEYSNLLLNKGIGVHRIMITDLYPTQAAHVTSNSLRTAFIVNETTPFDNAEDFTIRSDSDIYSIDVAPPATNDDLLPSPGTYDTTTPVSDLGAASNQTTSLKLLRKARLDPAMIGDKFNTPSLVALNSDEAAAVSSILYRAPSTTLRKYRYAYRTPYQKVRVTVPIRRAVLEGLETFTIRAFFFNSKGQQSSESVDAVVKHTTLLDNFITPTKAPTLHADYLSNGSVKVSLRQNDDKGRRVAVFRRKSTATDLDVDAGTGWTKVFDRPVNTFEDVSFIDRISSDKFLIYRALTYGANGRPCEGFGHDVVRPAPSIPAPANDGMTAIARFASNETNPTIVVDVINVPSGVSNVRLRRYDVTFDSYEEKMLQSGKGFKYIKDESGQTNVAAFGTPACTFVDETAVLGRSYRYVPVGISGNPNIHGTESIISVPFQNKTAPVSVIMSDPVIPDVSRDPNTITFSLRADFTDFGFNEIRKTLAAAGAADLYEEQFAKNRSGFSSLISFLVERENLTTGLVESFGIVEPGEFRDDFRNRQKFGVMPPQEGVQYNYSAQALVGSADAMFPDLNQRSKDPRTLTVFDQALSKFKGGATATVGTLPSTARQFDFNIKDIGSPADPRLDGLTTVREVRTIVIQTRPVQLRVKNSVQFYHDHALVSWSYDGNRRDTDHFRLSIISGNGSIVVDTIHCDPDVAEYTYRHFGPVSNPGSRYSRSYKYEVVPIQIDYSPSPADTTSEQRPSLVTPAGAFDVAGVQSTSNGPRFLYAKPPNTELINISRD